MRPTNLHPLYIGRADTVENQRLTVISAVEAITGSQMTDEEKADVAEILEQAHTQVAAERRTDER